VHLSWRIQARWCQYVPLIDRIAIGGNLYRREWYSTAIKLNGNWKVTGVVKASLNDIKPGMAVFVPSQKAADGTLSTGNVIAGTNGVVPTI